MILFNKKQNIKFFLTLLNFKKIKLKHYFIKNLLNFKIQ